MAVPPSDAEPSAKPVRASLKLLLVPAIAMALAFAVWWSTPRLGGLAPYELEVEGPSRRGPVELAKGVALSLLLRPRTPDSEAVEASVFLQTPAGQALAPLPASVKVVGPGVLRVTVSGAALPEAGRLLVLVGRSGLLPGNPVGLASRGRDWQRFDLDFTARTVAAP
jgi:hypothetical protein